MALLTCDFFSDVLEMGTSMSVVLPQAVEAQIGVADTPRSDEPPVLYLLHGLSDDHSAWLRYTPVERYADQYGVAVVMPRVDRSFYADEAHGLPYWTFLSEELPSVVGSFFRVSQRREDTFVAGLSMGGYGALKWALRHPDRFAAAASMSGALDLAALMASGQRDALFERVYDGRLGTGDDLLALVEAAGTSTPLLHVSCGTEDELLAGNERFVSVARRAGAEVTVDFRPGEHEWGFWDRELREVLAWLPLVGARSQG